MPHTVSIDLNGKTHDLTVHAGETIFAAARRAGIAPPFSCIAGYCGSCIATIRDGEVKMKHNQALSPKQVAGGLVLTCQAVPASPQLQLVFGDHRE